MAPESTRQASLTADLPHLGDPALEMWLKFLAEQVDCLTEKSIKTGPRLLMLETKMKYVYLAIGLIGGVLFGHLGWK